MDKHASLNALVKRGSFAAELYEPPVAPHYRKTGYPHVVVVDGFDSGGNVLVRDPFHATRYEMTRQEFLRVWTSAAVWRK